MIDEEQGFLIWMNAVDIHHPYSDCALGFWQFSVFFILFVFNLECSLSSRAAIRVR